MITEKSRKLYKASLGLHPFTDRDSTRLEAFMHIAKLNQLDEPLTQWYENREEETFQNHCANCQYYREQKDTNGETVITYCSHGGNKLKEEGNTRKNYCPLEQN